MDYRTSEISKYYSSYWLQDVGTKRICNSLLKFCQKIAEENHCYKMMLLTGSKEESTLQFYQNTRYNSADKTAFIQWINMQ